jgi:hypothetical protein
MTEAQLVADFYGNDPLRGEDASLELVRQQGSRAIETLIPLSRVGGGSSLQVVSRLKSVATVLGPGIVPYLVRVIEKGEWSAKLAASPCFAGFEDHPEIEAPLLRVLEKADDFDAERIAIEALGYLGADGWAWDLVQYAKDGDWRPGAREDWDEDVSDYPFEKLSSYVLEAISRFAGLARSRERVDSLFRLLSDFIELRQQHVSHMFPDSYAHVFARDAKHTLDFTGWIVDPMISLWGRSPNERLRRLCLDTRQGGTAASGALSPRDRAGPEGAGLHPDRRVHRPW